MILLLAFAALAVAAMVAILVGLARDGYRATPTDALLVPDRSTRPVTGAPVRRAYPRPVRVRRAPRVQVRARA